MGNDSIGSGMIVLDPLCHSYDRLRDLRPLRVTWVILRPWRLAVAVILDEWFVSI
jgi:hypothetical protein